MALAYQSFEVPNASFPIVNAINNAGQIAGHSDNLGFLLEPNGDIDFFTAFETGSTLTWGLGDNGQAVGSFFTTSDFEPDGVSQGYIYDGTDFTIVNPFPQFPERSVELTGINSNGQISGFYLLPDFAGGSSFLLEGEDLNVTDLDIEGSDRTLAWDINDAGKVVGQFRIPDDRNSAFVWENGNIIEELEFPGASFTTARGINNNDSIVGWLTSDETEQFVNGFIWENGEFEEINFPGATGTFAADINDGGVIIGDYSDQEGNSIGFRAVETGAEIEILDGDTNIIDVDVILDFDSTRVGTPTSKTLTIANTGDRPLILTDLNLPDGFSVIDPLPNNFNLAPENTVELAVQLDAETGGAFNGTLELIATDSEENLFGFTSTIYGAVNGGRRNDTLVGSAVADALVGRRGNDRIFGKGGDDNLQGRPGNDHLFGGDGNDILIGGIGRDRLNGGEGNDTLTGGASIDRFIFATNQEFATEDIGVDTITDFDLVRDLILLDRRTFNAIESDASIDDVFATVTTDTAAESSEAAIVYNSNNGNLFYNANGSDAGFGSGGQFAILENQPELSGDNFFIRA
ncbi:MAG: hypothetical protein F6K25_13670 [Okeania sp. SIO2G4]|uniref:Ig-like domain-containing protein n=1 Tax=unclassified Okeania TaxID=2634635 RepID=UPI0013B721C6|nr:MULTISPECIES: hypothetical protein [unclassified Okeania]NEP70970.1 hypothetical protein [Okeania sp. SIO2G5]NEP93813.1 hypothetical protein [Okeania sp. SIO2F5]NEQ91689.1 hypothetical protein [Okeania sp. SIO2G4]